MGRPFSQLVDAIRPSRPCACDGRNTRGTLRRWQTAAARPAPGVRVNNAANRQAAGHARRFFEREPGVALIGERTAVQQERPGVDIDNAKVTQRDHHNRPSERLRIDSVRRAVLERAAARRLRNTATDVLPMPSPSNPKMPDPDKLTPPIASAGVIHRGRYRYPRHRRREYLRTVRAQERATPPGPTVMISAGPSAGLVPPTLLSPTPGQTGTGSAFAEPSAKSKPAPPIANDAKLRAFDIRRTPKNITPQGERSGGK